jgi:hypothetical protein
MFTAGAWRGREQCGQREREPHQSLQQGRKTGKQRSVDGSSSRRLRTSEWDPDGLRCRHGRKLRPSRGPGSRFGRRASVWADAHRTRAWGKQASRVALPSLPANCAKLQRLPRGPLKGALCMERSAFELTLCSSRGSLRVKAAAELPATRPTEIAALDEKRRVRGGGPLEPCAPGRHAARSRAVDELRVSALSMIAARGGTVKGDELTRNLATVLRASEPRSGARISDLAASGYSRARAPKARWRSSATSVSALSRIGG